MSVTLMWILNAEMRAFLKFLPITMSICNSRLLQKLIILLFTIKFNTTQYTSW